MHELGVVMEVVRVTEEFARANEVTEIDTVVLQIGELSAMIPKYVRAVYPAAVEGTLLAGSRLEIEVILANVRCRGCGSVFGAAAHREECPACGGRQMELLGGREFAIKEIQCR